VPPTSDDLAVLDQLAEDFVGRLRRGERPPIQTYSEKNPKLAADIERLFPTLVAMERMGSSTEPTPPARQPADVPQRIGGYRIIRLIGEGGMGLVYEAVEESLGRHVALKVLPSHARLTERFRERFTREARAAARLHHPHIVPVFNVGEDRGTQFYAMQFIRGRALDTILGPRTGLAAASETVSVAPDRKPAKSTQTITHERTAPEKGPAHYRWVAEIGTQVADALAFAHEEGVIHRDVKPSNLLLDDNGAVWVTDFGLAKTTEADGLTAPGDIVGTLRYMAPERFSGWSDARSDVYGLGATLFELLTGRAMFDDPDRGKLIHAILQSDPPRPRKLNRNIPRDLETIVLKATAREPGHRYASAQALAEDLRRFLGSLPIHARRHTWAGYAWRLCRRKPLAAAMAATLALTLLVLLVGSLIVNLRLDDQNRQIVDTQMALGVQLAETNAARGREAEAHIEARRQLMRAFRREAEAARWSRRPGSRGEALEAVRQLMQMAPEFPLSAEETQDLRNLVIATSAQLDFVPEPTDGPPLPAPSVFAPDLGHYAVRANRSDASVRIYEYPSGREVARLKAVDDTSGYHFTPDGSYLIVRDGRRRASVAPHTLVVWRWAENRIIAEIPGSFDRKPWAVSPDSRELVVADGKMLVFYSLSDGTKLRSVDFGKQFVVLDYDSEGQRLAAVPLGFNYIEVRAVTDGMVLQRLIPPAKAGNLGGIGWSANGRLIAAGFGNYRAYAWHVENGQLASDLIGHQAEATGCFFDPNDQWVAANGWDNKTHFWNPVTGGHLMTLPGQTITAISSDGQRIGYQDQHAAGVWSVTVPRELRTLHGHVGSKGPWQASFGVDGQILATSSTDAIRFWETRTGRALGELRPPGGALTTLFTPDGKYLFAVGHEHCTRWPTRHDAEMNALVIGRPEALLTTVQGGSTERRASLSADGQRASMNNQFLGRVFVFPLEDPALWRSYGPIGNLANAHLSADGRWVIGTTWPTPGARVWDTLTHQLVKEFRLQKPVGVAFSPDGEHVVLGSVVKGEVWKVGTWEHVRDIPPTSFGPAISHPQYSPDGRILAVCRSSSRHIHLLDARTFEEFARLEAPDQQPIHSLAFGPDGSRLVAACGTRVVQMWDLRAIRERLAALGLDWDQPAYPPEAAVERPLRLVVEGDGK